MSLTKRIDSYRPRAVVLRPLARGRITRIIYDGRDRRIAVQRKTDAGVFLDYERYELDSEGNRLSVTDAENRTMRFAYDLLDRVVRITDPAGKVTRFGYDAAGNWTSVIDALNRETRYEYDDLNRKTAVVQLGVTPNATTKYSYDAVGNVTALLERSAEFRVDDLSTVVVGYEVFEECFREVGNYLQVQANSLSYSLIRFGKARAVIRWIRPVISF